MSSKHLALVFLALSGLGIAGSSIAACVGDDGVSTTTSLDAGSTEASVTPPPGPAALKANGLACGAGTECTTGQCADGVCCDAKCDGICEKCSLPGSVGTCAPIPDTTDPDNERPTAALDAGAPTIVDASTDEGGLDGGDEAGVDASVADVADAGPTFNLPDGGFPPTVSNQCAGHCNGKRACAYAGADVTCGTSFCGNNTEQGHATCDGRGHCLYGVEECSAYACPDGSLGCKTSCAAPTDCLSTFYCDGTTSTCKPRFANGVECDNSNLKCQSGFCTDGVCCNSACDITGGTCAKPGSEGQCQCSACATGPCDIFYRDLDGDHYGDINGTILNGGAVYGCAGQAPAGFVADHTDCFDSSIPIAAQVYPGQTAYFDAAYTAPGASPSFDYNCSGAPDKQTTESGLCGVCEFRLHAETQAVSPAIIIYCIDSFYPDCTQVGEAAGHACSYQPCGADNAAVFTTVVDCGKPGNLYTCDPCTAVGGSPPSHFQGSIPQRCH